MALTYKIVATKKPGTGMLGDTLYYPKLTDSTLMDLRDVSQILAQRTTASEADIRLVVTGLMDLIPELLLDGKTVKLDHFGSFRLYARAEPSPSADEVKTSHIRGLRISFLPDKRMKAELAHAKFMRKKEKRG
ncbi:MAG: HU family DNA-binding protein [Breznakibacter sp.]